MKRAWVVTASWRHHSDGGESTVLKICFIIPCNDEGVKSAGQKKVTLFLLFLTDANIIYLHDVRRKSAHRRALIST